MNTNGDDVYVGYPGIKVLIPGENNVVYKEGKTTYKASVQVTKKIF